MFLSIIIPTYNDEQYLDECLGSCLAQDIDDYEIICVDDGSTDRTPQMLDAYSEKHPRISVIHKEHGVGYGRNIGMAHARGDYLWFVDHDDMIEANCLGSFRKKILQSDCDRLVFHYYEFFNALSPEECAHRDAGQLRATKTDRVDSVVWTSIVSKRFLLEHDIWPHSKRLGDRPVSYGCDAFFVRECKEAGARIETLTDRPYYYYRKYLGQSVNDYSDAAVKRRIDSYLSFALMYRDEYEQDLQRSQTPSFPLCLNYVVAVRTCAQSIQAFHRKHRRAGMARMREEGLFPLKLPQVYTDHYSWRDCVAAPNGMGPLRSIAFYYSVHPVGLFLFELLDWHSWLKKLRSTTKMFRKMILFSLHYRNRKDVNQ